MSEHLVRGKHSTLNHLLTQRKFRKLLIALFSLMIFLAIIIVPFEAKEPFAKIKNLEDSIWWAVGTITTVGYGDIFPITREGRAIGLFLQLIGVVFFGTVIGSFTFSLRHQRDQWQWEKLFKRQEQVIQDINQLNKKLDYLILSFSRLEEDSPEFFKENNFQQRQLEIKKKKAKLKDGQVFERRKLREDLEEILGSLRDLHSW